MWANAFVGIPFADNGRTAQGCDCWGLYRLAVAARRGILLPAWDDVPSSDLRAVHRRLAAERPKWPEVAEPGDCDLVLMRGAFTGRDGQLRGGELHVGCCVEGSHVLHTEIGSNAVLVPLAHMSIRNRILGFHRLP